MSTHRLLLHGKGLPLWSTRYIQLDVNHLDDDVAQLIADPTGAAIILIGARSQCLYLPFQPVVGALGDVS